MQRELNPNLFGPTETREAVALDVEYPPVTSSGPSASGQWVQSVDRDVRDVRTTLKHMEGLMKELSLQVRDGLSQVRDVRLQLEESGRVHNARMDRITQVVQRMEQFQTRSVQDLNEKYAGVVSRVNERRVTDGKIEDLIDRHNHIVQNFETRLKQMQKVISDREMQMLKTMTILEDARAELARMKKL